MAAAWKSVEHADVAPLCAATRDAGDPDQRREDHLGYIALLVGQPPWSAADALVGLLGNQQKREEAGPGGPAQTRGSAPLCGCRSAFN